MFGGVWGLFPDRLDFRVFRFGNVYADTNAYVQADGSWLSREIPSSRTPEGLTTLTVREENQAELVIASKGRSGGQWDRWQVAWAPIGSDGYPKPLWDKKTGHIDRAVAEAMRQSGYDLRDYAGAELEDVRPAAGGEAAHRRGGHGQLFLNLGVYRMETFSRVRKKREAPYCAGSVEYGRPLKPHGWQPWTNQELLRIMIGQAE